MYDDFLNVFNTDVITNNIIVYFKNGSSAVYTTNVLSMIKEEPDVVLILSESTGEVLFQRKVENNG